MTDNRPWSEIVKEYDLRECRQCKAVISGTGNGSWGRSPNREDSSLCECCIPKCLDGCEYEEVDLSSFGGLVNKCMKCRDIQPIRARKS